MASAPGRFPLLGAHSNKLGDLLLAGCKEGPNNFSYDARIGGRFNGAFTYYALKALKTQSRMPPTPTGTRPSLKYLPSASYPRYRNWSAPPPPGSRRFSPSPDGGAAVPTGARPWTSARSRFAAPPPRPAERRRTGAPRPAAASSTVWRRAAPGMAPARKSRSPPTPSSASAWRTVRPLEPQRRPGARPRPSGAFPRRRRRLGILPPSAGPVPDRRTRCRRAGHPGTRFFRRRRRGRLGQDSRRQARNKALAKGGPGFYRCSLKDRFVLTPVGGTKPWPPTRARSSLSTAPPPVPKGVRQALGRRQRSRTRGPGSPGPALRRAGLLPGSTGPSPKARSKNAQDIVDRLPAGAEIHLVSHSRGGLVGELLCLGGCDNLAGILTPNLSELFRADRIVAQQLSLAPGRTRLPGAGCRLRSRPQGPPPNWSPVWGKTSAGDSIRPRRRPGPGTTLASGRLDRWLSALDFLAERALGVGFGRRPRLCWPWCGNAPIRGPCPASKR